MRLFLILIIGLFNFQLAFAQELNGNLDYTVRTDKGIVKLNILNKKLDTPVSLSMLSIVLSSGKQLPIVISPGQPISPNVTVELGTVSTLAKLIAPDKNVTSFTSVVASDSNNCQNCESIGLTFQINVEYGEQIKQNILTHCYLHFLS